jgi:hypothetical protein
MTSVFDRIIEKYNSMPVAFMLDMARKLESEYVGGAVLKWFIAALCCLSALYFLLKTTVLFLDGFALLNMPS